MPLRLRSLLLSFLLVVPLLTAAQAASLDGLGVDVKNESEPVLCAEKDNLEVEYALKTKANPIGVAAYRLQATLPAAFKGKLPTARQLAAAIRPVLPGGTP